jgi:hypothetical protein
MRGCQFIFFLCFFLFVEKMSNNIKYLKRPCRSEKILKFQSSPDDKSYDEWIMVITPFNTQKIIEAYNQQLTIRSRVSTGKTKDLVPKDVVTISEESKKQLAAAKSFQEPVKSLTKNQGPQAKGGI